MVSGVDIGGVVQERSREDRNERRARELAELLQELRVMLPGVQVLFAFLLTRPFSVRFGEVTSLQQQAVFFGTLLWRRQAREHRLRVVNRLALAGMVLLVVAMVGVMFVIPDLLFGFIAAAVATATVSGFLLYVWFLMPIRYRLNGK
jgi:hypothetical protein